MKKTAALALFLLLLLSLSAYAACSHYDKYGTHDWECLVYTEANCTTPGKREWKCRVCGEESILSIAVNDSHEWIPDSAIKEPTCTEGGRRSEICSLCGKTREADVKPQGHEWTNRTVTKKPDCENKGETVRECVVCGLRETEETDETGHAWGSWQVIKKETRSSSGERARVCRLCGKENAEVFYPEGTLLAGHGDPDEIAALQEKLIERGCLDGSADGVYGKKTSAAVETFQSENGLEMTGIAYPETLDLLFGREVLPEEDAYAGEFCASAGNTKGKRLCARHAEMELRARSYTEDGWGPVEANLAMQVWLDEVTRLYDEAGRRDPAAAGERDVFFASLAEWEKMREILWNSETDAIGAKAEILKNRCIFLCEREGARAADADAAPDVSEDGSLIETILPDETAGPGEGE